MGEDLGNGGLGDWGEGGMCSLFWEGKGVGLKEKEGEGEEVRGGEWEEVSDLEGKGNGLGVVRDEFEGGGKGGLVVRYWRVGRMVK